MKKLISASLLAVTLASSSYADPAKATGNTASEPSISGAVIDTAESSGKSAAGSAIDQAAGAVSGVAGSDVANLGKSLAGDKANSAIGGAADDARASFGVNSNKVEAPAVPAGK